MTSEVVWRPPWPWMLVEAIEICLLCSSSQESPQHQEKVRKNKSSDGDVVHKKVSGKPATTRDAGTLTRAASTDVKAIQVSLPGNQSIYGWAVKTVGILIIEICTPLQMFLYDATHMMDNHK